MHAIQLSLIALGVLTSNPSSAAQVTLQEVWAMLQQQQAQIAALSEKLEATEAKLNRTETQVKITEEQLGLTVDYLADAQASNSVGRTSVGGYGELHYNAVDGEGDSGDFKEFDFHRFVLSFGHEFTDRIRFISEFELEHALVQDTDDGSNSGEVELEQAYIEMDLDENHWSRAGVFLVPVGILNETHEPPAFYGVERNDVENIIIPSTWWEAGISGGGHYASGLSWDFGVHSGLQMPTSGVNAYRVRSGRQKVSAANAEKLAYTLRLKYTGLPGLELAASYHHQSDASQLRGDGLGSGGLVSFHGIWNQGPFSLRVLWAQWNLNGDAVKLADVDEQTGWYIEPSIRLDLGGSDWGFYTRYEDLEGARSRDRFEQWEVGFNFWPADNIVLKFDYRDRQHDLQGSAGFDFQAIDLGVGYQF